MQKAQKSNVNKADTNQKAKLPVLPRLINLIRIRIARRSNCTYDTSWNAAYKIFTMLRSITKGVKKLEVLIVNSTFKVTLAEVDAIVMDYPARLDMLVEAERVRRINSYGFEFQLLDSRSIGAVIKGENSEIRDTAGNLVTLCKNDDIPRLRRNGSNTIVLAVEECFFVYLRDVGLYGMARVLHQEYAEKKDTPDLESKAV